MARFYQTAERKYLEDGIYKPPVELMAQVIAAKDKQLDDAINNINVIKNNIDTNIKYWAEADKDQANALQQYFDDTINNITGNIMTHPLQDFNKPIFGLQQEITKAIKQGGSIYNLAANEAARAEMEKAFDTGDERGTWGYRHNINTYLNERGDTPLDENNLLNYKDVNKPDYLQPIKKFQNIRGNLFNTIKDRAAHVKQDPYINTKNGTKGTVRTEKLTEKEIDDLANLYNFSPEEIATMKYEDAITKDGWMGNGGKLWFNEDGTINKDDNSLWKNNVEEAKKLYYKDNRIATKDIWNDKLFFRAHGIKDPDEEVPNFMPEPLYTNSPLHQQMFATSLGQALAVNGGKSIVIDQVHETQFPARDNQFSFIKPNYYAEGFRSNSTRSYVRVDANGNIVIGTEDNPYGNWRIPTKQDWVDIGNYFTKIRTSDNQTEDEKVIADTYGKLLSNIQVTDKNKIGNLKTQLMSSSDLHIAGSDVTSTSKEPGFSYNRLSGTFTLDDLLENGYSDTEFIQELKDAGFNEITGVAPTNDFYNLGTPIAGHKYNNYSTIVMVTVSKGGNSTVNNNDNNNKEATEGELAGVDVAGQLNKKKTNSNTRTFPMLVKFGTTDVYGTQSKRGLYDVNK